MKYGVGNWRVSTALLLTLLPFAFGKRSFTERHEKGRCALRGHCGSDGFFGPQLPCPDNGLAKAPDDDVRKKLVGICGDKWSKGDVCCNEEQVSHSGSSTTDRD